MTIEETLNQIKKRCEAATSGPWFEHNSSLENRHDVGCSHQEGTISYHSRYNDMKFIAHARTDVPRLVEMVEYLINEFQVLMTDCYCEAGKVCSICNCKDTLFKIARGENPNNY